MGYELKNPGRGGQKGRKTQIELDRGSRKRKPILGTKAESPDKKLSAPEFRNPGALYTKEVKVS
jgi:hypothetical protein